MGSLHLSSSEPVGGASPKLSGLVAHTIASRKMTPVSLQCPAQGAPLPAFRSVANLTLVALWKGTIRLGFMLLKGCPSLASA